ncbi:hypothetical protein OS493_017689 [Desmophyllum pertusum]|uniref:G-protein coupled receptors family 1 profile domain-containing protein n=1 Tax=Desmophyllum pertusum TaxID=174260 RepID=A0A9W9ZDW5_9CNID|nr:hypothetical protein OS493_017689 [Desmophyllum pertusum]
MGVHNALASNSTFIAIERYCAVVFHLRYNEKVTVKRTMVVLSSAWIIVPLASTTIAVKQFDARNVLLVHGIFILIGIFTATILDCLMSVFSVFGNGLVIFSIYHSTDLHSPSHLLIAGLALSDFGTGLITQPSNLIEYVAAIRGDTCTANMAYLVLNISGWVFTMLSLLTLTFIAIERYCAVVFHLRYNEKVTVKRTMVVLSSAWIIVPLASTTIAVKQFDARNVLLVHGIFILIGIFTASLCYLKVFLVVRRHFRQINIQLQAQTSEQVASNTAGADGNSSQFFTL